MAEIQENKGTRRFRTHHRGRIAQVGIYFGKLLRMFIYQSDWKVFPMAAVIASLVVLVMRRRMFVDMEMTMIGAFAIVMICIWNGCFNSIQVICRERDVIKREHRLGMHISAYIFSHMLYQALLCAVQTVISIYVMVIGGIKFPASGIINRFFLVDFGIAMFLITFAADMMSLWISALSRTTTAAMTIMPFILIFQLVFSGGMLPLPEPVKPICEYTISGVGVKLLSIQTDLNSRPFTSISDMLVLMRDREVEGTVTVGQVLELLQNKDINAVAELREKKVDGDMTAGELIDLLAASPEIQAEQDKGITLKATVGELLDILGEEDVKTYLSEGASAARYREEFEPNRGNIANCWIDLIMFALFFALLATITLEFIDKDKR